MYSVTKTKGNGGYFLYCNKNKRQLSNFVCSIFLFKHNPTSSGRIEDIVTREPENTVSFLNYAQDYCAEMNYGLSYGMGLLNQL